MLVCISQLSIDTKERIKFFHTACPQIENSGSQAAKSEEQYHTTVSSAILPPFSRFSRFFQSKNVGFLRGV